METNKPTTEEKIKASNWLSEQDYQTEEGPQEYRMYFDVDIPKMLAAYHKHQSSFLIKERDKYKEMCEELDGALKNIMDSCEPSETNHIYFSKVAKEARTKYNNLIK